MATTSTTIGFVIGSPMLRARASIILDPPEDAWFDLSFMHKDIELALDAARRSRSRWRTAIAAAADS